MNAALLLAELKRRRVFRVAAGYAVIGWLLIQVAATTVPHLPLLPGWTVTFVIVLTAAGFPVVLVLAWLFDITRDGIRRTGAMPAQPSTGAGGTGGTGGTGSGASAAGSREGHGSREGRVRREGHDLPTGRSAADARLVAGGRYELRGSLGAGAMGVVYRALDTRLQREVALKFLPESMELNAAAAARFLQEARAAAALSHPNITTLHAIEEDDARPYLVMEVVEGETLEARLAREGALPVAEAIAIAAQVAAGLAAAHARGIVHRDIKPANLMLAPDGLVKIMDFGIARLPGGPAITQVGSTLGSAAYMSPEQVRGTEVDGRSDVWGLGAVLYEMLCGCLPFPGDNQHTVLHGVLNVDPEPVARLRPETPDWLAALVHRALSRDPAQRPHSAAALLAELRDGAPGLLPTLPQVAAPRPRRRTSFRVALAAAVVAVIAVPAFLTQRRDAAADRARGVALPALLAKVEAQDCLAALLLADDLERLLPGEPQVATARAHCTVPATVITEPAGADVYIRTYGHVAGEWYHLGRAPLRGVTAPMGQYHWRVALDGYEDVEQALHPLEEDSIVFTLVPTGTAPAGMVRVPAGRIAVAGVTVELGPYWFDRFEVTNAEFQAFIDAGGYTDPQWWRHPFVDEGHTLGFAEAMDRLLDATGQPGPATWELGSHPDGRADHPVDGVSWYEAAAFCEWAGKELPTVFHWRLAAGGASLYSDILWTSNFDGEGTVAVGSRPALSRYGAYDMAGNVKEWTWNDAPLGRYILGGAWNEPPYLFTDSDVRLPLARSETYGFRCARYDEPPLARATEPVARPLDITGTFEPVSDAIYDVLVRPYAYDATPLNARVEGVDDSSPHWRRETVSFDAVYGGERVVAHIYIPRNAVPPFQPVVYFPSGAAVRLRNSTAFDVNYVAFVPRSGRVLVHPVLKGTYERRVDISGPQAARDVTIQRTRDISRTVDYLLTRDDIDPDRIAYFGLSLGANFGPIVTAVEDRFAASILVAGGLIVNTALPEISPANFAPRVRVPTVIINGRHDLIVPYETRQLPLYHLLGTAEADKALRVLDGSHVPDSRDIIRESNAWLDRYLGPVRR
jgi:eukaryotic-like serine/threonine-protein kinase